MAFFSKLKIILNFLRLTLIIAIVVANIYYSWLNVFISSFTLVLTFLPVWFERKYKITIPLDFEFLIIVFIYASLFLGETLNFYERFWWWDIVLHGSWAIAFGCIGFIILFILFKANKIIAPAIWLVVFSFCFAVSIGAIWEIFEFGMDQILKSNMQKTGLVDTMWDLIFDSFGALLASLAGYAYLKRGERSYLGKIINFFIQNKPYIKV